MDAKSPGLANHVRADILGTDFIDAVTGPDLADDHADCDAHATDAGLPQAVESGEYASASEVVREALRDWKFRRAQRDQIIAEVGRQWDAGIASGPATEGKEAFSRVRARVDAMLSDRGVA